MTRNIGTDSRSADPKSVDAEKRRRLRQRNWALLAALVGFVVLVYVVTIVKLKGA